MTRRRFFLLIAIGLALLGLRLWLPAVPAALGQDPTIPTRTPTPDPNAQPSPTATRQEGGTRPPAATETPTATATTAGAQTPLPTATATATTTTGGLQPQAGGCDDTPIVIALAQIAVYAGPGRDYLPVGGLQPQEIRRIVGRAEFSTWWQIQLDPTNVGWVADEDVDERGNTGSVPLAAPPDINGNTPTPGPLWSPTPRPDICTPTPTPSPTPTSTATATATATSTIVPEGAAAGDSSVSGSVATGENADSVSSGRAGGGNEQAKPVVDGADEVSTTSTGSRASIDWLLPLAGVGLIAVGIIVALIARGRGSSQPNTPGSGGAG